MTKIEMKKRIKSQLKGITFPKGRNWIHQLMMIIDKLGYEPPHNSDRILSIDKSKPKWEDD